MGAFNLNFITEYLREILKNDPPKKAILNMLSNSKLVVSKKYRFSLNSIKNSIEINNDDNGLEEIEHDHRGKNQPQYTKHFLNLWKKFLIIKLY